MRRFFACLLMIMLLPVSSLCESGAERLANLDILSQRDSRVAGREYYYKGMLFHIAGCKPASVTNAFMALLGSSETDAPRLLMELRKTFSYNPSDEEAGIELTKMPEYLRNPRKDAVLLRSMLRQVTSIDYIDAARQSVEPAYILARYPSNRDAHPLIIRDMYIEDNWSWLVELAAELCRRGYPDARIALCAASVGTEDMDGPFRSGKGGHYVAIYLQAGEFHQEGTVYLLDSLPRALEGDIYGFLKHYPSQYAFVSEQKKPFAQTYNVTRLQDPVLQLKLKPAELDKLNRIPLSHKAARNKLRTTQCEALMLFHRAYFLLYLP